jgi:hypothetical protein
MFNPKQYRDKAAEYSERAKTASGPNETREFAQLEKSFTTLADNEQWLSDNHQKMVQTGAADLPAGKNSFAQEEHVLRCLGAALIMQWGTLPAKLQRELFDSASSMGELLNTASLREQIARFLHKHEDGKTDGLDVLRD